MSVSLSVVMPVHNEAAHLPATIDALVQSATDGGIDADFVLVDDGSTDGSADAAAAALAGRLPLRVVAQPNRGRFEARRAGLQEAKGEFVLFLDARVSLHPAAIAFVAERLESGENVWTGHVDVVADGNPFAVFWKLLAELAWEQYFRAPRTTSYDAASFDLFPKGTTCFLAPRELLREAVSAFRSRYADLRHANDDTPLIRWIAERERIHISPEFACSYEPRISPRAFLRHAFHRGVVFLDGHGTPGSRFFPAVVAFYPASTVLAVVALRRPTVVPLAAVSTGVAAGFFAAAKGRTVGEIASLAALAPVYATAHGLGMWRGLGMLVGKLVAGARPV